MILFDCAAERGFLDLAGLDVSIQVFFLSDQLDEGWRSYCQKFGVPNITVHSAYGGRGGQCVVKCLADPRDLTVVQKSSLVESTIDRELTMVEDGVLVSEPVSEQTAFCIARIIVAMLNFARPQIEWEDPAPLN